MTLIPGTKLGHYEIVALLGVGGMGEVYRATDARLGRAVALKILPEEMRADADRMRRFALEARAASALSHPNVAHIYEIEEIDGRMFIAMEFVEGARLDSKVAGRPLPVAEIVDIGADRKSVV